MTGSRIRALVGLTALVLVAHAGVAQGQTASGSILGTVLDSTGGVLPGVTLSAKSPSI